jgi:hypothetical protein
VPGSLGRVRLISMDLRVDDHRRGRSSVQESLAIAVASCPGPGLQALLMLAATGLSVSYLLEPFPLEWNEQRAALLGV